MKQFKKIGYPKQLVGRFNSFITTEFDDSLTIEMQMRVLIKWIKENVNLTDEMVDYLNEFIMNFDGKLYKTVHDILYEWINSNDIGQQIIDLVMRMFKLEHQSNDELDIGGVLKPYFLTELNNLLPKFVGDRFRVAFNTDLHWDEGEIPLWYETLGYEHLTNIMYLDGFVDAIIFGGDNCDSYQSDKRRNIKHLETYTEKVLNYTEYSDAFCLLGNHDDSSIKMKDLAGGATLENVITESEFAKYFRANLNLHDEKRLNGSLYFYKDYPDKKIRVIGLNSCDTPSIVDSNGKLKYLRQYKLGYRKEQLVWLSEHALSNVPEDYAVIVFTHVHPFDKFEPAENDNPNNYESRYNMDNMMGILEAFKNGGTFYAECDIEDWQINYTADFTSQGKRDLIGVVNGHVHKEGMETVRGITNVWCTLSRLWLQANAYTSNQDAFSVFEVDKENRTCYIYGFGRATDRQFTY